MNYYEHHIGDYAAATAHLSLIEDAIYSRLLRRYYMDEAPLPADAAVCVRLAGARTAEEREAAEAVINEFFPVADDGLRHNKRADEEIAVYKQRMAAAIANGKKGGRPKKAEASHQETGSKANETQPFTSGFGNETKPKANETQVKALHAPSTIEEQKPSGAEPPEPLDPDCKTGDPPIDTPADPPDPLPGLPPTRGKGCTFATFIAECLAKGEKPIPEDHPVFRFADDAGIPLEFVRLAWMEFRRDFGDGGNGAKKRQAGVRGWRQHFDNAVRKGWYRLWSFDRQGECYLTPAGIALQREAEARDAT